MNTAAKLRTAGTPACGGYRSVFASDPISPTPRTDFVAHGTGDPEWDRFPNRFARMMAHACILERENARLRGELDRIAGCARAALGGKS